jgi:hypothetical protein
VVSCPKDLRKVNMTKESPDTKPKASTGTTSTNSSSLTLKEKRMKSNAVLKKLFKTATPMAPDREG